MSGSDGNNMEQSNEEWDDLLGTGTIMKQVLVHGSKDDTQDIDMEAPRRFFALIDIETRCNNELVESESHKNYLINVDSDLFAGAHLVIPLMNVDEKCRCIFDSRFCYGEEGNLPNIPANSKLDCIITLKLRSYYDEFLSQMNLGERILLANRKKDRGKFWFSRSNYQNAIVIYQSLTDLCRLDDGVVEDTGDRDRDN